MEVVLEARESERKVEAGRHEREERWLIFFKACIRMRERNG
jgi:hypothetical protein